MKFLVRNYSYLQNLWLGGYCPQIPVLSVLCPQLNLLNPPFPRTKFLGTPLPVRAFNWTPNSATPHIMQYNTVYGMLEYALEMTNSQACSNRELIYYMQYEVPVFSFPGVSVVSKWRMPQSSRSFQHFNLTCGKLNFMRVLYTAYERQWEGQRGP
jgi:hypothetical protein